MKASEIADVRILALIDTHDRDRSAPYAFEALIAEGIPEKVVYAKYDKLDRRGFVEWGVSLRAGWLTDAGRRELARLKSLADRDSRGILAP